MNILIACALTVVIETVFLALAGLRKKEQLPIIILVNIVSNITLNLILRILPPSLLDHSFKSYMTLLILEMTVIFSEYFVYRAAFGDLKRMFVKTFLANALSFALGGFLLSLIEKSLL